MNQDAYNKAEAKIQFFHHQLELCEKALHSWEQSGAEAEKQIEEHFAKCMNALAERKMALLDEVAQMVSYEKNYVAAARTNYQNAVEDVKTIMAEKCVKPLPDTSFPHIEELKPVVEFESSLFDVIQSHGKVRDSGLFSKVGFVKTLAGGKEGKEDGKGLKAQFNGPYGICHNPYDDCFYVTDFNNHSIRKVTIALGEVTTLVRESGLLMPFGIVMNYKENAFYVVCGVMQVVLKVTPSGQVSIFAGSGKVGNADGVGRNASFNHPTRLAIDQNTGNLYLTDNNNNSIRKITPQGEVTTLAGSQQGYEDGYGKNAKFNSPGGICFDKASQSLLVCDKDNDKLRRVHLNGEVSTVCDIKQPAAVAVTANNRILVTSNHKLYSVTYRGKYVLQHLAGTGVSEHKDGPPSLRFLPS